MELEHKKISTLMVEDNKLARKIMILILEQLNCHVDAAATGQAALDYLENTRYDIIFMDIGLPDIDGLTLIETIRKTEGKNVDVPIIALTAHSDKEYVLQSYQVGATDYIVKPLNNLTSQKILDKYVLK